jgi:hypothetical protein
MIRGSSSPRPRSWGGRREDEHLPVRPEEAREPLSRLRHQRPEGRDAVVDDGGGHRQQNAGRNRGGPGGRKNPFLHRNTSRRCGGAKQPISIKGGGKSQAGGSRGNPKIFRAGGLCPPAHGVPSLLGGTCLHTEDAMLPHARKVRQPLFRVRYFFPPGADFGAISFPAGSAGFGGSSFPGAAFCSVTFLTLDAVSPV